MQFVSVRTNSPEELSVDKVVVWCLSQNNHFLVINNLLMLEATRTPLS